MLCSAPQFFPQGYIAQVEPQQARDAIVASFVRWGPPCRIKFDNGHPFGNPQRDLPPPLALWLVGYGIEVIYNRPRHRQDNAIVERLQGTTQRWADARSSLVALAQGLNWACQVQRAQYPSLDGKTRLAVYPELEHNPRRWSEARFKLERVAAYLSQGCWLRKVSKQGQIGRYTLYGRRHQIGYRYRRQQVSLHFDASAYAWAVFDASGGLIKGLPAKNLSRARILKLAVGQGTDEAAATE